MPKRKKFSPEQRLKIIQEIKASRKSGTPVREASKKHGISSSQFYIWTKKRRMTKKDNFFQIPIDTPVDNLAKMDRAIQLLALLKHFTG